METGSIKKQILMVLLFIVLFIGVVLVAFFHSTGSLSFVPAKTMDHLSAGKESIQFLEHYERVCNNLKIDDASKDQVKIRHFYYKVKEDGTIDTLTYDLLYSKGNQKYVGSFVWKNGNVKMKKKKVTFLRQQTPFVGAYDFFITLDQVIQNSNFGMDAMDFNVVQSRGTLEYTKDMKVNPENSTWVLKDGILEQFNFNKHIRNATLEMYKEDESGNRVSDKVSILFDSITNWEFTND